MAAPGALQQQYGCGSGLDALTERFLRETDALDRDTEHLDARLRGRRQKKRGIPERRGYKQNRGRGGNRVFGSMKGGGGNDSNNGSCSLRSSVSDLAWSYGNNHGGDGHQPFSATLPSGFLASVNSNERVPLFLLGAADWGGWGEACSTSSPTAASAVAWGGAGEGGSCRVQSYFTQALGDESLCGVADRKR